MMSLPIYNFETIGEFIAHWATERPQSLALREENRRLTYEELDERTRQVAGLLFANGLKKGDRIAWIGKNSDLYFLLLYGAARAGVVMTPIGWRLTPTEWAYILNDTQAKLIFTGSGFEDLAAKLEGKLRFNPSIIPAAEANAMIPDIEPIICLPDSQPADAALQLYTSGTTGHPKGAILSHRNLFAPSKNSYDLPYTKWDDDEAVLIAMPCAHIGGTGLGITALVGGIPGIILAEFSPEAVFDAIEKHSITRLFLVPAALQILLMHPRCSQVDYSRLKYIIYGAAPIPLELLRQCIKVFGAQFVQAYGMTETAGAICMLSPEDHDLEGNPRMRSAGKPLPGVEIKIMGPEGETMQAGEVGEVVTRSSNNMIGYWNLPDATEKTIAGDGWIRTGDAGYLDRDGYLFIHDRIKDMIITGGENVYPAEVESAIFGHPAVQEVAVIGVPDSKWGEAIKAVVVPKPGVNVDEESIIAWARERIASFKCPRSIDLVEFLPRNASGKILRKDLRESYWEGCERMVN